jgi:hypothetical protein
MFTVLLGRIDISGAVIRAGILDRHPGLRMVLAEGGAGWLPWLVQDLDHHHA